MTETLITHIEVAAQYAPFWGYFFVFMLMAIESSFIPFPSEVVLIPAGFLAFRGELTLGNPWADMAICVFCGMTGSLAGAFFNYYFALWLGRPFLYRYGRYFFMSHATLDRAEQIFRRYGDITTFVCRLLPAIRQLISIPAGLARMNKGRFTFFTLLGSGLWSIILILIGHYLGTISRDMSYAELVHRGQALLSEHYGWIIAGLAVFVGIYALVHHLIMAPKKAGASS
jgi:membrane protein DedA with SNARE-associated domain